jgi:site-specific DNA-methyltransferase (adenine-specific)
LDIEKLENRILLGDCLKVMEKIPDKSIDMILCDLPYACTANKWDKLIDLEKLWLLYERVVKDKSAIVLICDCKFGNLLINSSKVPFRYDLIWKKTIPVGFLNANRMPLRGHELIYVFYKKLSTYNPQKTYGHKPYFNKRNICDGGSNYGSIDFRVVDMNTDGSRFPISVVEFGLDKVKLHSTQKPVALFEYLIKTYTNEGNIVLDNCIGSGTTAIACLKNNRRFIGIEKEIDYVKITRKRIKDYLESLKTKRLEDMNDHEIELALSLE